MGIGNPPLPALKHRSAMRQALLAFSLLCLSACSPVRHKTPVTVDWTIERPGNAPTGNGGDSTVPYTEVDEVVLQPDPHFATLQNPLRVLTHLALESLGKGQYHAHIEVAADEMASLSIRQVNGQMAIGGDVARHLQPGVQDVVVREGVPSTVAFNEGFVFSLTIHAGH